MVGGEVSVVFADVLVKVGDDGERDKRNVFRLYDDGDCMFWIQRRLVADVIARVVANPGGQCGGEDVCNGLNG